MLSLRLIIICLCLGLGAAVPASEAERKRLDAIWGQATNGTTPVAARLVKPLSQLIDSKDSEVSAQALLLLGQWFESQNNCAQALQAFALVKIKAGAPKMILRRAELGVARVKSAQNDREAAVLKLNELAKTDGMMCDGVSVSAVMALARIYLTSGDLDVAGRCVGWALDNANPDYQDPMDLRIDMAALRSLESELRFAKLERSDGRAAALLQRAHERLGANDVRGALADCVEAQALRLVEPRVSEAEALRLNCALRQEGWTKPVKQAHMAFLQNRQLGPYRGPILLQALDGYLSTDLDPKAVLELTAPIATATAGAIDAAWGGELQSVWLRAGIAATALGDKDAARSYFLAASAARPVAPAVPFPPGWQAWPDPYLKLIARCSSQRPILPSEAQSSAHPQANVVLVLGELAFIGDDWPLTEHLLARVADGEVRGSPQQIAYACFRISESRYWRRDDVGTVALYDRIIAEFPKSTVAPQAMLRRAINTHNRLNTPGIYLDQLAEVIKRYPQSEQAVSAQWLTGHAYEERGMQDQALAAFLLLNQKYPTNPWKAYVIREILPRIKKAAP